MLSSKLKDTFLQLVRLGIGTSKNANISDDVDWAALKALADRQGLSAVVLDGLNRLPLSSLDECGMPQMMRLEWIGEVLQNYEHRYEKYNRTIAEMAAWHQKHGYKMMVLKGYACSLDWPKPEHRPCGDIDIWQFGEQKKADAAMKNEGIEVDSSHHHHTVFYWNGFMVENHYDFINVFQHKSHVEMEKIFKELGKDDSYFVDVKVDSTTSENSATTSRVYIPSPNLHALFLIKHILLHFVSGEMTFRQLLDWAFFVRAHKNEVDWVWLEEQLEKYGMKQMFNIINAICIGQLGFDVNSFPQIQFKPKIKDRIVKDMFSPEFSEEIPQSFLRRFSWRYRHWKANAWKHELCFKESMWSSFWSGVWGHLLKPKSI